jgi:cobalamin biosynthesis protein CbiG
MSLTSTIAVYALTRQGAALAERIARGLSGLYAVTVCLPRRLENEYAGQSRYFERLSSTLAQNFNGFQGHVVVGATGMVVRIIAPLLQSKAHDPAVVVLPQDGRYAISLLSGHLGGGNRLALDVAEATGGQAVIGTATDLEAMPALEVLARDYGLAVENPAGLALFSRRLVEGEKIKISDPAEFFTPHLTPWRDSFEFINNHLDHSEPQVRVDYRLIPTNPLDLVLRPRIIFLGLGCHRGAEAAELEELIDRNLAGGELARAAVAALATVDIRADEPAILEISRKNNWPLMAFTRAELARVATPNPSEMVKKRIGVASVCEAAALLAARTDRLIITKMKSRRATLAAAVSAAETRKRLPAKAR